MKKLDASFPRSGSVFYSFDKFTEKTCFSALAYNYFAYILGEITIDSGFSFRYYRNIKSRWSVFPFSEFFHPAFSRPKSGGEKGL